MSRARKGPPFASWRSFWTFEQEVTRHRRYMISKESQAFLAALLRTSETRSSRLAQGHHLCRAQVAHAEQAHPQAGPLPGPALPSRMIPLPDKASDGRANPRGIPCLYMADNRHTAIAEVRPWIGSLVSVAIMRVLRDQRLIDCRDNRVHPPIYLDGEPSPKKREEAVWAHVARAFRQPVLRDDDRAGYAATQIVAEAFRDHGYDGIAYGSGFGRGATNIVLFDTSAAEITACELHEVKDVTLDHKEVDNPYFVEKLSDGTTRLVRNVITAIGPVGGPMISLDDENHEISRDTA